MDAHSSIKNSPMKATPQGFLHNHHQKLAREARQDLHEKEMRGLFIGPCPAPTFLDEFLPSDPTWGPAPQLDFSAVPTDDTTKKEADMYKPFKDAIESSGVIAGYHIVDQHRKQLGGFPLSPDLTLHKGSTTSAHTWATQELSIEIKMDGTLDICNKDGSPKGQLENPNHAVSRIRGQITGYASAQLSRQHRLFVFLIYIFGSRCRIFRYDRAGSTASISFDYKLEPHILAEFLWRHSNSSDAQRGYDPTVSPATPEESTLLTDAVDAYVKRVAPRNVDYLKPTGDATYPAYRIAVCGTKTIVNAITKKVTSVEKTLDLVVRKPFYDTYSACGRATKGFAAYDLRERRLVFLKDYWRTDDEKTTSEAEIYHLLVKAGVRNLADNIASGDVLFENIPQTTLTDMYGLSGDYEWAFATPMLRKLTHHRVVQELAFPIRCALSSLEMAQAIHDVIECIGWAYHDAHVLHRDVSTGNVMIRDRDPSLSCNVGRVNLSVGILNDWDHGIIVNPRKFEPHYSRTGTWQFMSIKLLRYPGSTHEIQDDFESCFWVLLHTAFHHFKHNKPNYGLEFFSEEEWKTLDDAGPFCTVGGNKKKDILDQRKLQAEVLWGCIPLRTLIHRLAEKFRRYIMADPGPKVADFGPLEEELDAFRALQTQWENTDNLTQEFRRAFVLKEWPPNDRLSDQMRPASDHVSSRRSRGRHMKAIAQTPQPSGTGHSPYTRTPGWSGAYGGGASAHTQSSVVSHSQSGDPAVSLAESVSGKLNFNLSLSTSSHPPVPPPNFTGRSIETDVGRPPKRTFDDSRPDLPKPLTKRPRTMTQATPSASATSTTPSRPPTLISRMRTRQTLQTAQGTSNETRLAAPLPSTSAGPSTAVTSLPRGQQTKKSRNVSKPTPQVHNAEFSTRLSGQSLAHGQVTRAIEGQGSSQKGERSSSPSQRTKNEAEPSGSQKRLTRQTSKSSAISTTSSGDGRRPRKAKKKAATYKGKGKTKTA